MKTTSTALSGLTAGLLVLAAGISSGLAAVITVPMGLNLGDQYRLVFVTDDGISSTSADIADYNNFVTTQATGQAALAELNTTWTAIGSTLTVDARNNTNTNNTLGDDAFGNGTGVAIYGLSGLLIADDNANLWGTVNLGTPGTTALYNPININQTGEVETSGGANSFVHTGTKEDGTAETIRHLGNQTSELFGGQMRVGMFEGSFAESDNDWVKFKTIVQADGSPPTIPRSIYGISGILTVVPEPSSAALLGLGGLALLLRRRR